MLCFYCYLSVLSVLNTSSLLCDCHMQWLGPWLIDSQFQQSVSAVCAHPASLLGRSVLSISPEEFVCGQSCSLFAVFSNMEIVYWHNLKVALSCFWFLVVFSSIKCLVDFDKPNISNFSTDSLGNSLRLTVVLLILYWHSACKMPSFTLPVPAAPQTISPSHISRLIRRRLWHYGGTTSL